MRTFRCIYINCYISLRFFAYISKKLQKGYNFWQFKDHKSGKRYENNSNDPIFFICFSSLNCLGTSFFHLKTFILWGHLLVHSTLQNTWILEVKAVRFCRVRFRKHTLQENEKPGFTSSIELTINSKMFRVISWSKVAE